MKEDPTCYLIVLYFTIGSFFSRSQCSDAILMLCLRPAACAILSGLLKDISRLAEMLKCHLTSQGAKSNTPLSHRALKSPC